jgi:hypothetical protein
MGIGMATRFEADLEFGSDDFVKLSEMLTEHYGDQIDFVDFLAGKISTRSSI